MQKRKNGSISTQLIKKGIHETTREPPQYLLHASFNTVVYNIYFECFFVLPSLPYLLHTSHSSSRGPRGVDGIATAIHYSLLERP